MRAIIDNFDHISKLTQTGGVDVGPVPGGVGLDRLRWTGSALVDLIDLSTIHVRRANGRWWFHAIAVPGSQPVSMHWAQRKRIINDAGTFRILSDAEWDARIQAEQTDRTDNKALKVQLTQLVKNTSYADLENKIDQIFSNLSGPQQTFLLQLSRVVLYLAKKEIR